jgi:uncharacterized protein
MIPAIDCTMLRITSIFGGILGIFCATLTLNVVITRNTEKISIGVGDNKLLEKKVRAHGNFTEYVPLSLILFAIIEIQRYLSDIFLIALGVSLITGRLFHAYAFLGNHTRPSHLKYRVTGMFLTLTTILLSSMVILYNGIFAQG